MKITVCIGSSCHIKGSRQVVEQLQYLIRENNLDDKVELSGTFCMGKCQQGVCVRYSQRLLQRKRSCKGLKHMIIQICVGSACHLKGSEKIVGLFEDALKKYDLENDVTLAGSFCTGRCNREGVTISVDDDVYTGITPEGFNYFFEEKVLKRIREERV